MAACHYAMYCRRVMKTHGKYLIPAYRTWAGMIQRCTNPKQKKYLLYGGRGIRISKRWRKFENFYADMGDKPGPRHTIDRKNSNGNYNKRNCRWVTIREQNSNTSRNRHLTFQGETLTLSEWARRLKLDNKTLHYRLEQGWPKREIFSKGKNLWHARKQ